MVDDIIEAITKTIKPIKDFENLPTEMGIYAFYVDETTDLGIFGRTGQLIYVGIAKKSLRSRDIETHFKPGQTGFSSLRRSLGAILKTELKLSAQKRDLYPKKLRADKYKFDEQGEAKLTTWMFENLKMGYWSSPNPLTNTRLREEEKKVIIRLKPTLDLDKRTKNLNPLAIQLDSLREICRQEVKKNNQI
uniref:GIY-YIG catalytic domain-containing protein n=1 Tax=Sphingobacterium sp. (strain 21) TaxID=743722 RepID=F4C5T4_SPHS2